MTASRHAPPRPVADLETAEQVLRQGGLRLSAARRVVLQALFAADGPVSAEAIAGGLGGQVTRSDLGSVYRNLDVLEAAGLVGHVHLGHGAGLYVLAAARHEYVTCETCGRWEAVAPELLDAAREAIRSAVGFDARFTHFPIVGRCPDCAETGHHRHEEHHHVRPG